MSPETREKAKSVWEFLGQQSIHEFDGHCQLFAPSLECFKNALADPYYRDVVLPDEAKFLDGSKCMRTVGWEECYINDGKVVHKEPNYTIGIYNSKL